MSEHEDEDISEQQVRRMVQEMHRALFGNGRPEAALLSRVSNLERHVKWLLAGIGTVGATLFSQLIGFWATR